MTFSWGYYEVKLRKKKHVHFRNVRFSSLLNIDFTHCLIIFKHISIPNYIFCAVGEGLMMQQVKALLSMCTSHCSMLKLWIKSRLYQFRSSFQPVCLERQQQMMAPVIRTLPNHRRDPMDFSGSWLRANAG